MPGHLLQPDFFDHSTIIVRLFSIQQKFSRYNAASTTSSRKRSSGEHPILNSTKPGILKKPYCGLTIFRLGRTYDEEGE